VVTIQHHAARPEHVRNLGIHRCQRVRWQPVQRSRADRGVRGPVQAERTGPAGLTQVEVDEGERACWTRR
jgi:hypothetical protein